MKSPDSIFKNEAADKLLEQACKNFINDNYWKIFIEPSDWFTGIKTYNNQFSPGYAEAATKALYYMLLTLDWPLTVNYILGLQSLASHERDPSKQRFSEWAAAGIATNYLTYEGMVALFKKLQKDKRLSICIEQTLNSSDLSFYQFDNAANACELAKEFMSKVNEGKWKRVCLVRKCSTVEVAQEVQKLIAQYTQEIEAARDRRDIKMAIIKLIQDLHQFHPFLDKNGTTFIHLLLPKLLIMNGCSPSIVQNPPKFSCGTLEELLEEVNQGESNFQTCCTANYHGQFWRIWQQIGVVSKAQSLTDYLTTLLRMKPYHNLCAFASLDIIRFFVAAKNNEEVRDFIKNTGNPIEKYMANTFSQDALVEICTRLKENHLPSSIN